MKTFKLPCYWSLFANVEVEAESLAEAIRKVEGPDFPLPDLTGSIYVDDSFEVDLDNPQGIQIDGRPATDDEVEQALKDFLNI